ncbi:MAG: hypothetical protein QNJ23_12330 [Woeseiaceae bacterium]|nr:hypothetical protein [Woeseiaceae bacterium]
MFKKAASGRDAFTFSLHGLTTIASFTPAPAIAQDRINKAWDERLEGAPSESPGAIRRFEDFLARYFAPGCCQPV